MDRALRLAKRDGITLTVIDTPATINDLSSSAIRAANLCLIPARPSPADIEATLPTLDIVRKFGKPFAFVLNQAPPRGNRPSEAATALNAAGVLALPIIVHRNDHQDALGAGFAVTEFALRRRRRQRRSAACGDGFGKNCRWERLTVNARRSEQPVKRPTRRSMVELAALLQSDAVVETLPSRQPISSTGRSPAPALREQEGAKPDGGRKAMISGQIQEIKSTAVTRLRPPDLDGSGPKDENDTVVALLEEVTLAAAKAAQDCRAQMLDDVKVKGTPDPEQQPPAPAEAVEAYHARAVELMNANVNSTLDYARRLAEVRSPAEFIALSTKQACRHFELIMTHAAAFGVFSQLLTAARNARDVEDT